MTISYHCRIFPARLSLPAFVRLLGFFSSPFRQSAIFTFPHVEVHLSSVQFAAFHTQKAADSFSAMRQIKAVHFLYLKNHHLDIAIAALQTLVMAAY